jgi:hypothetical protein
VAARSERIPEHTLIYVIAHGVPLLSWIILFPVQSFLIAAMRMKAHQTLGGFTVAVAGLVVTLGTCVAVTSVRDHPGERSPASPTLSSCSRCWPR